MPVLRKLSELPELLTSFQWLRGVETLLQEQRCESLLDVGCGPRSPLRLLAFSGKKIGIDAYLPAIEESRVAGIHDEYICGSINDASFEPRKFDAVIALEVIEHLPKTEGPEFLARLESLARRLVIISTPNGFVPQGPVDGNPYQEHLSGWLPHELRQRGYEVNGSLGLKGLRGEEGRLTMRPKALAFALSKASEPFVWGHPEKAFGLVCHKVISG